ncbi:hypothetical protein [Streptomyces sp. I05A-00742]|uniref:hypothetical protein n=1 Tax=Streptomyces sp. I05A-00742 TaxID=2732853 RepID=UPI001488D389|nr:hypothetical protein [Streptomyces sp. I05A-00742]
MSAHSDRLVDVVAATLEVAAESGHSGYYTPDVGRALAAVVQKVAEGAVEAAEVSGFVSGWQEAVGAADGQQGGPVTARVLRIHQAED